VGNGGTLEQAKRAEEMMMGELPWLSPIGALTVAALAGIALALALPRHRQGLVAAWIAGSHLAAAALAAGVWLDRGFRETMSGTVVVDGLSLLLTALLGVAGAVCVALARPSFAGSDREGEFYVVLAGATLAAVVLGSAADLALVAIALSLLSLASFVMTGYLRGSPRSNEAAVKYYLYGIVAGAAMAYGFSLWFGLAGSTDLRAVGASWPTRPPRWRSSPPRS
jgi:NADH:ubiquinone oxidoreductase subunit 2 (subunit N)